jgi:hypothetical protein
MEFALTDNSIEELRVANEPVLLLPLIKLEKGATLDNLEILDYEDRHVSPLLQEELYGLLANLIEGLFRSAYINVERDGNRDDDADRESSAESAPGEEKLRELTPIEEKVLRGLIQIVSSPERTKKADVSSPINLLNDPDLLPEGSDPLDKGAAEYLRSLCEFFGDNYLIAVEVELPRGSRLSVKYTRTVPLYEQASALNNRSRVRLGMSPRSFTAPLTLPFEAPSYHFSLAGVPGSFVADQRLVKPPKTVIEEETFKQGDVQPFLKTKCKSALPYAHLHARGLQRFVPMELWTIVEFDEVPPGALGGSLVVSVACAILIWFFALVQPGLHDVQLPSHAIVLQESDLPALLLTVPAFVATWIGNSVDRVQRSSISTYVGLGVSTVVSFASALLYIANVNDKSFWKIKNFTFNHGLLRLHNVDGCWLVLALIASIMSAYLAETLRERMHRYMLLLANDSGFKKSLDKESRLSDNVAS